MKTYTFIPTLVLAMTQFSIVHSLTRNFNATFDDINPILEQTPFTPIGTYNNILFTSMYFNPAFAGLTPQSPPNYALGFGSASTPAAMTISYRGSTVQSFTLSSLYYGCLGNPAHPAASVPTPCNITATGYKTGSPDAVTVQHFVFEPAAGGAQTAPLAFGGFEAAFEGLEHVTFARSPAANTAFVFDDIVGTTLS